MIDRLIAAAAGMASAFYLMAACVAWFRVAIPPSKTLAQSVMPDRAVAWSALSALCSVVAAVKLSIADWANAAVDLVLGLACLAIFLAGLVSVRAITHAAFGYKVLAVFAAVSVAVGLVILLA